MASYIIGLAYNTGWSEQFILWDMPLARGLQYQHAALCIAGAETVHTAESLERELDEVTHGSGNQSAA